MAAEEPQLRRRIEIADWVELRSTVKGAKDPVMVGPGESRWNTRTPDGVGALQLERTGSTTVEARAWGDGAAWLIDQAPKLLGADDDIDGFSPPPGRLRDLWRRGPFLLGRTDRLWDAMVGAVLGQKVQTRNAVRSRRLLARQYGDPGPGPWGGRVLPSPEVTARLDYSDFHPLGVERKRAETLLRVAREMPRLRNLTERSPDQVCARLEHLRGIGVWTTAMATAVAMGNADAVPVGDYHVPNTIVWHLAGEPRGTDEQMLELLEPYRGHRWRVVRLAKMAGGAPKRGPRLSYTGDGLHRERLTRPPH